MSEIRLDTSVDREEAAPFQQSQLPTWSSRLSDVISRLADAADAAQDSSHAPELRRSEEAQRSRMAGEDDLQATEREPGGDGRQDEAQTPRAGSSLGGILRQLSNRGEGVGGGNQAGNREPPETAAAAAERHRLTESTGFDLQAASRWVDGNTVFVIILLVIFLVQHIAGCILFAYATLFFTGLNLNIKRQVARKDASSRGTLLLLLSGVLSQTLLLLWPFQPGMPKYSLSWKALFLQLPRNLTSVWDALYLATLADIVARLLTAAAKLVVLLSAKAVPEESFRRRGRVLNAVEHVSMVYRVVVTTPIWLVWLHQGSSFRFIMTYVYMGCKLRFALERLALASKACRAAWNRNSSEFGKHLEADDLLELGAGTSCAICQEPMTRPLQLQCKHAFCEACICEWLERELTCPMCRTQVKAPGNEFKSGSISLFPQIL